VVYIQRLHPKAREDFELPETFIAELEFDKLMPKHVKPGKYQNFQGFIRYRSSSRLKSTILSKLVL